MYRAYVRCKTQTITVMCTVDVVNAALSENLVNKLYGTIYLLCVLQTRRLSHEHAA